MEPYTAGAILLGFFAASFGALFGVPALIAWRKDRFTYKGTEFRRHKMSRKTGLPAIPKDHFWEVIHGVRTEEHEEDQKPYRVRLMKKVQSKHGAFPAIFEEVGKKYWGKFTIDEYDQARDMRRAIESAAGLYRARMVAEYEKKNTPTMADYLGTYPPKSLRKK